MQNKKHSTHLTKKNKWKNCLFLLSSLTLMLNLAAFIPSFCDKYTLTVYEWFSNLFGKCSNIIPLPIGELLMYFYGIGILFALFFSFLLLVFKHMPKYKYFLSIYLKSIASLTVLALFLYTIHWTIPFRSHLLGERGHFEKQYSTGELRQLWLYTVEHLNEACTQVERDENGHIQYPTREEMEKKTTLALQNLSRQYPRLKGFYPRMKPALCSDVLEWMQIGGYTYPYTMEITYNHYISDLYFPSLYAHEAAHHQGYYQENEANFLSYLSCSQSDDPILRYSAYHTIYFYVDDAYSASLSSSHTNGKLLEEYKNTKINPQVFLDEQKEREKKEQNYASTSHPLQNYSEIAENAADIGWNTQGEFLAQNSYDGVVQLLLEYYLK